MGKVRAIRAQKNCARLLGGELVYRVIQVVNHLDAEPVVQRGAQRQDGDGVIECAVAGRLVLIFDHYDARARSRCHLVEVVRALYIA
jgi:hypothetical protein